MFHSFRRAIVDARRRGDLYFAALVDRQSINEAFGEASSPWQGWIYTPAVTVWVFLSQCLSPDHSCREAVARLSAWRTAQGWKGEQRWGEQRCQEPFFLESFTRSSGCFQVELANGVVSPRGVVVGSAANAAVPQSSPFRVADRLVEVVEPIGHSRPRSCGVELAVRSHAAQAAGKSAPRLVLRAWGMANYFCLASASLLVASQL